MNTIKMLIAIVGLMAAGSGFGTTPEKVDLGADAVAFYPFDDGKAGESAAGSAIYDRVNPEKHLGQATLSLNGAVDFDADSPGSYVFTNFVGGATAVYTNPASIRFVSNVGTVVTNSLTHVVTTNWASGNIDFADIATELSKKSSATIEFFWKIDGSHASPSKQPTMSCDMQPVGCSGLYELWLPLTLDPKAEEDERRAVWMADAGDFEEGVARRIAFSYPTAEDVCDGLWHHFALTYSNGVYRMYCDYELGDNAPNLPSTAQTESKPLSIGKDAFHGKISCVKVTARALKPSEMLHASSLPGCVPSAAETVRWRFDEGVADAAVSTVSNRVPAYSDENPSVYISKSAGRGDGVVVKDSKASDPVFTASVWKKIIRETSGGRLMPNTLGVSLVASTLNDGETFAEGAGILSPASQLVTGSFTAEFFAKLDYAAFKKHVSSVSSALPRVALMTHVIEGLGNGAWNLYLDDLVSAPVVRLSLNLEGKTGESEVVLLTSLPNESLRYKWHHYAIVYDEENSTVCVYLDGDKIIEKTDLESPIRVREGSGYRIGSGGNSHPFDGLIDEVRVSRGVLGLDEFLKGRDDMGMIMLYRPKSSK